MKLTDTVLTWAETWRNLNAWGRPLTEVSFKMNLYRGGDYGTGSWVSRQVVVNCCPDMIENLNTVLHELAHVASGGFGEEVCRGKNARAHGPRWRELFARATEEVTGIPMPGIEHEDYSTVDALVTEALRTWWKSNGLDRLWKMALDKPIKKG